MRRVALKKHNVIFKMALIAVFAALNFIVMLLPKIPVPSLVGKPYIHLGNLVVVLASIFFGGVVGGLSGAIGMGAYDLMTGYGIWTLKTVILKFGIGIVTGFVYKLIKKRKDSHIRAEMIGIGSFFFVFGLFTAILAFLLDGSSFTINGQTIVITWLLYAVCLILGFILILGGILSNIPILAKKKGYIPFDPKAVYASTLGIIFNIFGELLGGFIKKVLTGQGAKVAIAMSIASIPATIINGCVVIIIVGLIFYPINKALSKLIIDDINDVEKDIDDNVLDNQEDNQTEEKISNI